MTGSTTAAAVNAGGIDRALLVSSSAGFVLGCLTLAGLCLLYSATWEGWVLDPSKVNAWKGPALLIGSVLVVLVIYLVAVRNDAIRIGDWFVLGYAAPLVVAAGLAVSWEIFLMLRTRVPQNLGLKTVRWRPSGGTPAPNRLRVFCGFVWAPPYWLRTRTRMTDTGSGPSASMPARRLARGCMPV